MTNEPFFRVEGDAFIPNPISRGPWDPNSLHGRVIAGLLASEIDRRHGDEAFQFARLTSDLWRLPGFVPIEVRTALVREGGRIRVVDAECFADGLSIGRASAVLLRRTANPEGTVWQPGPWDLPPPGVLTTQPRPPEATAYEPPWEIRSVGPAFGGTDRKCIWVREIREMIEGQPLTPLQRVAMAADMASPLANSGDAGLHFINVDITLYLHRLPAGEWIGLEVVSHGASEGVAVGECALHDEFGAIGRSTVAALAQRRRA